MTKFYESAEAKTHELFLAEQSRLTETRAKLNQSVLTSTEEATNKTRALNAVEQSFIHDHATTQQVEKARQEADAANAKLTADRRLLTLADNALIEINAKIEAAQKDCVIARRMQLQRLITELSTNLNTEIMDQLLEIKAAETFTGIEYGQDWSRFLARIFPAPELTEIVQAQDKFCQKHKFNR